MADKQQAYLSELEQKYSLRRGTLDAIWNQESTRGANDSTSVAGAIGPFQLMPSTAKQYGVKNPRDFVSSADGAARIMRDNLSTFSGDYDQALAAYNWGAGHVQRQGMNRLPTETRNYVKNTMRAIDTGALGRMFTAGAMGKAPHEDVEAGVAEYIQKYGAVPNNLKNQAQASYSRTAPVAQDQAQADISASFGRWYSRLQNNDPEAVAAAPGLLAEVQAGTLKLSPTQLVKVQNAVANPQAWNQWTPAAMEAAGWQGVRNLAHGAAALIDVPMNASAGLLNLAGAGANAIGSALGMPVDPAIQQFPGNLATGVVDKLLPPNPNQTDLSNMINVGTEGAVQSLIAAPALAAAGLAKPIMTGAQLALELATGAGANIGAEKGQEIGGPIGGFIGALGGGLTAAGATNLARAAGKAVIEAAPEVIVAAAHPVQTVEQLASAVSQKIAGTEPFSQARQVATIGEVVANVPYREVFGDNQAQWYRHINYNKPLPIWRLTDAGKRLIDVTGLDVNELHAAFKAKHLADIPVSDRALGIDAPTAESMYPLPAKPSPLARAFGAEATGIPLTAGEVVMNPKLQGSEANLRAATNLPEEQGRALAFKESQKGGIVQAVDNLYKSIDVPVQAVSPEATLATKVGRGEAIREGLSTELAKAQSDTKNLYEVAKASDVEIPLDTPNMKSELSNELNGIVNDEYIPETSRRAVIQRMAKYDLIGTASPTVDSTGYTTVTLGDGVTKVKISGRPEPLTLNNADEFRKSLNDMYDYTDPYLNKRVGDLKRVFDNKLDEAVNNATIFGTAGKEKVIAFETARAAFKKSKATWEAKDLLQSMISNKSGTNTPRVIAEDIGRKILGADKKNFEAIMDILKNPSSTEARVAYNAVQMEAISSLFDKAAIVDNAGNLVSISGAKLKSAVERLPAGRLEVILSPTGSRTNLFGQRHGVSGIRTDLYKDFKKLQMLIGDATVPLADTQNPSGTAYKLMSGLGTIMASGVGALTHGTLGAFGGIALKHAYDFMNAKRLLETMYSPEKIMKLAAEATVPKEMINFRTAFNNLMLTASQVKRVTPVILTIALTNANQRNQQTQQNQQNKKK